MNEFLFVFIILSLIMIIRYGTVGWAFNFLVKKLNLKPLDSSALDKNLIQRDIGYSLFSSVIFAFSGALMLVMYQAGQTRIYEDLGQHGYTWLMISFIVYLLINDTYYYWVHRLLHKKAFYRFHVVHHYSKRPTAWTSFAFHPVEAILQASVIPALVLFVPIHWAVLSLVLLVMTLFGVTNHLGHELYPALLERKLRLITATHHQKHHRFQATNFGLFFTFWDQAMKTENRGSV